MGSADFKGGERARALAEVLYLVWVLLGIFAAAGSFCCCWEFLLLLLILLLLTLLLLVSQTLAGLIQLRVPLRVDRVVTSRLANRVGSYE